jgi:hypothetical protein
MSSEIKNIRNLINKILKEDYRFEYKQTYKIPSNISDVSKKAKEVISKNNLIKNHKEDIGKKVVTGERRATKLINGDELNYNEVRALRDLFTNLEKEYKNEKTKGKTVDNSAIIQIWELNGGDAAKNWSEGILSRHHGKGMKHKELRRGTGDRNRIGNSKNLMKARLSRRIMSESEEINENNFFNVGGVLLIRGKKLENGESRLYVTNINKKTKINTVKKDGGEGVVGEMVSFGNNPVLRVGLVDGELKALGVSWNSESSMLENLGLKSKSVVLNDKTQKTPLHFKTLEFNSIPLAIKNLEHLIKQEKNIRWIY